MTDLRITGGEEFEWLARRLRDAADRELERELARGLDRGLKGAGGDVRESAAENLPNRGGLAEVVAASLRVEVEKEPPLRRRVVARGIDQLALINSGRVVHPTYGRRPRVLQSLPAARDWFPKPLRRRAGRIERELRRALDHVGRRITRG